MPIFWDRLKSTSADDVPESFQRAQVQRYDDPSLFVPRVSGNPMHFVPTSRDHRYVQAQLALGDLCLTVVRRPAGISSGQAGSAPVFSFPLHGSPARMNGHTVERPFFWLAHGRPLADVIEPRPWVIANIILPPGVDFIERLAETGKFAMFSVTDTDLQPIRSLVEQAFKIALADPFIFGEPAALFGLSECLLHAAYELSMSVTSPEHLDGARSQRIARNVDDFVRAQGAAHVGMTDIARELGVSVRSIQAAMVAVRGMGFKQYVRRSRLWDVRCALEFGSDPNVLIKSVALEHGFWHLGRFSQAYRAEFGETPTQTLQRAAHAA